MQTPDKARELGVALKALQTELEQRMAEWEELAKN
jgi:hypothetical protein